jgi:xylulokinase
MPAAAALEAGITEPGIAVEMTGTSSVLITSSYDTQPIPEVITMAHAINNQSLMLAAMSSTGASLKWFRYNFYQKVSEESPPRGMDIYNELNATAEKAKVNNDIIFLPYMVGERSPLWDTDVRGLFFWFISSNLARRFNSCHHGGCSVCTSPQP